MSDAASTWVPSTNVPPLPPLFSLSLQRTDILSPQGGLQHQQRGECSLLCYLPPVLSWTLHWHAAVLFPFKLIAPVGNAVSAHSSAPAITLYYSISRLPTLSFPLCHHGLLSPSLSHTSAFQMKTLTERASSSDDSVRDKSKDGEKWGANTDRDLMLFVYSSNPCFCPSWVPASLQACLSCPSSHMHTLPLL